jgi:hypothetical protein
MPHEYRNKTNDRLLDNLLHRYPPHTPEYLLEAFTDHLFHTYPVTW